MLRGVNVRVSKEGGRLRGPRTRYSVGVLAGLIGWGTRGSLTDYKGHLGWVHEWVTRGITDKIIGWFLVGGTRSGNTLDTFSGLIELS